MTDPWRIFRYRSVNDFLWQELELSQFYCCSPSALNDPFDCQVDWSTSLKRALVSPSMTDDRRQRLSTLRDKFLGAHSPSHVGVCCFTCDLDNPLMWSHYAASHRGVCLVYEIPENYFMNRYSHEVDRDFFFVGCAGVDYVSTFYGWLMAGDLDYPIAGCVAENALIKLLTVKARAWRHEKEFRIITRRPGKLAFEPGFLKQMVFGLATPEHHQKLLKKVAQRTNKDVAIFKAQRSTESDFEVTFAEITD